MTSTNNALKGVVRYRSNSAKVSHFVAVKDEVKLADILKTRIKCFHKNFKKGKHGPKFRQLSS